MRRTALALVSVAVMAITPAVAAAKTYAPPGKAGSSEYAETLPASGGSVAPPTGTAPASRTTLSQLGAGRKGAQKLAKLGTAGQSAAAFAKATAPTPAPTPTPTPTLTPAPVSSRASAQAGGSALSGVVHLIGGSDAGGIGVFLPLLLAFSLGAAVAVTATRVRRGRQPGA